MEIMEMNMNEVEARIAEMNSALEAAESPIEGFETEMRSLLERKAELAKIEQRKADAAALENGAPAVIIEKTEKVEERKMFDRSTVEYRNAFMAHIAGTATEEQRSILADNTAYGDGLSLPVSLDEAIWNQVATAHPIVGDVSRLNTGIAIKVTKMTPAAINKKKDSAASAEETYTSAEVVLVGADYHTYIKLSYAEAKMSQGAMEQYLINDIATVIGEAVAKDIFARILADAGTAQKVTAGDDLFADVKTALGKAKTAGRPVIYAPSEKYYDIVGAIKSGSPFNIGHTLGCEVKLDNAASGIVVVDPSMFVLNVIQDVAIESQRKAEEAKIVIGGYMRAEGCLRKTTAAAYIA